MANPLKVLTALSASSGAAVSGSAGLTVQEGGLKVNAGNITTTQTSIDVLNTTATTVNFAGAATSLSLGAAAGTLTVGGDLKVAGNDIKSSTDATAITLSGADVAVAGDLTVTGNDIKSSTGTAITLSGTDVAIAGDLTVTGNDIKASGGTTSLTLNGADVAVAGDLTVTGNDIKASGGTTSITLSGADVEVKGDLTVTGNDIKSSGGTTALSLSGADVTIAGNLTVRGTTTSVDSTTVNIGDKNINLGTGSSDLAVLSGGGIDLGTNAEVQLRYDNSNTAWTSNKDVNVTTGNSFKINGTSVLSNNTLGSGVTGSSLTSLGTITSLTASALNVTGLAKLDGNVNLGNQSSDIITATGQLTASEGIAIASGKKVSLGGVAALGTGSVEHPNLGATNAVIVSYNGEGLGSYLSVASSSGGPIEGTFVDISSSLGTLIRGAGTEGQLGGVTIIGGAGGVEVTGEGAGVNDINISSANGGIRLYAGSNSYGVYISSPSNTTGTLVDGALNIKSNESYSYITKRTDLGFDTINISGALKQLDAAIGGMNGASVSPTEYYNVRTVVSGTKQAGNSSIVFTLSGSAPGGQGGRTPNGSTITGLSASTAASLIQKLGGMSFDVAVRDMTSALWANDLVSVQLSASAVSNGFYWPIVTVDAPAATDGAEIRLIAINETANIIT